MGAELDAEEQFGPYLVYERLGVGGMATVHRALERGIEGFERMVALKRLLPHLAEDASFIKAFVREAKLASLLNHVNIVHIFELGRVGTEYFISMEYIDGKDIRRILRHARKVTGPPPVNVTVGLLLQLCDALEYAHTKSDDRGQPLMLVHRDVSPSNVIVTRAGHVKVIDFGIAKAQSSQLRTQTGRVKGKLAYMAPEAISGKDLDARSDLFACGVIAHELLTARPLFASKNEYQTLLKVQRGDIMPPSTFNQGCPPELDAIVLKALARDPDQRYSSATEIRDALLVLRKTYDLQTTNRDIAAWVDFAFSLEVPTGGFGASEGTNSVVMDMKTPVGPRHPTPLPFREDDEAVEIAWGGGEERSEAGAVLLEDVPDVSGKQFGAAPELDDIPPSTPSHGVRSRFATEPGHTPAAASPGHRVSQRYPTQTTEPEGRGLLDGIDIDDDSETVLAPQAVDTQPTGMPVVPAVPHAPEPVVRFKDTAPPPMGQPVKIVRTRQGISPARARTALPADDAAATLTRDSRPRISRPTIGKGIVDRQRKGPNKTWIIMAAIFAAGAIATAVTLFITRGADRVVTTPEPTVAPAPRAPKKLGTVKFNLEPPDAEVWIDGALAHAGSPWVTELAPGAYQIQIVRTGYSSWMMAGLELSANETQVLRVVLEPLSGASATADAALILTSTPPGLDVVLDGKLLPQRTPIKMPLPIGPHSIVLRQDGVEVWKQDLVAQANVNYELSPSMDAEKQRERAQRQERRRTAAPISTEPATVQPVVPEPTPGPAPSAEPSLPPTPPPSAPPPPAIAKPAPAKPAVTAPAPIAIAPPTAPAKPAGPLTVPPSAVTRISGSQPAISQHKHADLPSSVASKVCINHLGRVTSVAVITKLDSRVAADITRAINDWRYAPYQVSGTPTAACFVVSFRLK
ncbi:MAG: serine/threonine protein kinase [Myxococcales bacterium]|nr:serine/threonine protein kinase [Myxococcales bacterium]